MSKLRVGVLFGGRSTEHEVSVASATTVFQSLDPARYVPILIGIDHDGFWHVADPSAELLPEAVIGHRAAERVRPSTAPDLGLGELDCVFPIVHGRGGEDGSLQGLCELAGLPYVGPGVLSTALCMDKVVSKAVLRDAGLPVVPCLEVAVQELARDPEAFLDRVEESFDFPVFVKPTNTGSSVGVSRAGNRRQLHQGVKDASRYDLTVLVEPSIDAREIECGVIGGTRPEASVLGEILFEAAFYDYAAKYASDDTRLVIPADVPAAQTEQMRELAVRGFEALRCWGMARVDFFLERETGRVLINELNTLPGFTDGSMFPKLWAATGINVPELVDRQIELALERARAQRNLEVHYRKV